MKINDYVTLTFIFAIFLAGCSVNALNEDAVDHYKKESPIEVDITVPEPIILNQPQLLKVTLKQNGNVVHDADDVRFTVWKKDSSSSKESIAAKNDGNGEYSVETTFLEDGLYYVKVQASSEGSTVMPTKQFIAGKLTEEELKEFQNHSPKPADHHHEGHH